MIGKFTWSRDDYNGKYSVFRLHEIEFNFERNLTSQTPDTVEAGSHEHEFFESTYQ